MKEINIIRTRFLQITIACSAIYLFVISCSITCYLNSSDASADPTQNTRAAAAMQCVINPQCSQRKHLVSP